MTNVQLFVIDLYAWTDLSRRLLYNVIMQSTQLYQRIVPCIMHSYRQSPVETGPDSWADHIFRGVMALTGHSLFDYFGNEAAIDHRGSTTNERRVRKGRGGRNGERAGWGMIGWGRVGDRSVDSCVCILGCRPHAKHVPYGPTSEFVEISSDLLVSCLCEQQTPTGYRCLSFALRQDWRGWAGVGRDGTVTGWCVVSAKNKRIAWYTSRLQWREFSKQL